MRHLSINLAYLSFGPLCLRICSKVCFFTVQGFFGTGYFVEDQELNAPNILRTAERKKILSNVESLGLLSAAEKAGLSLSKVPAPFAPSLLLLLDSVNPQSVCCTVCY